MIYLYTNDFLPMFGGVADYSANLAAQLHHHGLLGKVITSAVQKSPLPFPVDSSFIKHQRNLHQRSGDGYPIFRKINTLWHFFVLNREARKEARRLKSEDRQPYVIITAYYDDETPVFIRWLKTYSIPYAIVLHGLDIIRNTDRDKSSFVKHCRHADLLIFNSNATAQLFRERTSVAPDHQYVLYPGVDPGKMMTPDSDDKKGGFVMTSVCTLVKRKGLDIALRAFRNIAEHDPEARYIIVGDGPERNALEELASDLGIRDAVKFSGRVDEAEKFRVLEMSHVFVMPTRSLGDKDFEGFGISFLEAAYFGNILIGGKHGGVPESIGDEGNGYMMNFDEPGVEDALSDLLSTLHARKDTDAFRQACDQARRRIRENFDWKVLASDFLNKTGLGVKYGNANQTGE
ncbi:MAG: glycosyltransferase family 4 protein [Flavobacteriales bacterium]|nr:glycosyltransferase family 4 protein [Flavobacteriales bacterium]